MIVLDDDNMLQGQAIFTKTRHIARLLGADKVQKLKCLQARVVDMAYEFAAMSNDPNLQNVIDVYNDFNIEATRLLNEYIVDKKKGKTKK